MHKDLPESQQPSRQPASAALRRFILAAVVAGGVGSQAALAGSYDDALSAANMGDAKELVSLIQRGLDPDTVDAQGNTLLILAAREGHTAAVEALAKNRARLDYRNPAGDSALMLAVLRGHEDAARALIKAGAVVAHDGWAPLHYAAFEGRDKLIADILAAGADVNAPAPNKATPLMLAARNGHIDVVRRLLALPQTDLNALNDAGLSADAWALQNNNTDIAELIQAERKRRGIRPPAMKITIE
ncbi:MAG: ankyrin repeat domain-containing protein [Thauera sp.]|nr:ankyrin repeat domain-containing protein [Thauera sp.]